MSSPGPRNLGWLPLAKCSQSRLAASPSPLAGRISSVSIIDPESVYETVRQIPVGSVITYGDLAERIGRSRGAARAVGNILGNRPDNDAWMTTAADDQDIPWWRVVKADGTLRPEEESETDHRRRGLEWAKAQLAREGVAFTNDGRVASLAGPRHPSGGTGRSRRVQRPVVPEPCGRHDTVQYSCRDCAPNR